MISLLLLLGMIGAITALLTDWLKDDRRKMEDYREFNTSNRETQKARENIQLINFNSYGKFKQ